jgi:hypothetical protein
MTPALEVLAAVEALDAGSPVQRIQAALERALVDDAGLSVRRAVKLARIFTRSVELADTGRTDEELCGELACGLSTLYEAREAIADLVAISAGLRRDLLGEDR